MRFICLLAQNRSLRCFFRSCSVQSQKSHILRVLSENDDNSLKLFFSNSSSLSIKTPKSQEVSSVLSVIKLKHTLLQKREEMKRSVVSKYYGAGPVEVETLEEYDDIGLYKNDRLIDERTPNIEAWSQASLLKIGDISYEVHFNMPIVRNMSLPNHIVCGCYIRPHFIFECANVQDSLFTWYRSKCDPNSNSTEWIQAGEGFHYCVTSADVGCFIKIVCSPRRGSCVGLDYESISKNVVEAESPSCPIIERHAYTTTVTDNSRFRCVTYNTLANVYVERRKFPYSSEKARDVYFRKQLLIKELLGYNSDVICLQEVQERVFEHDFSPLFKKFGYDGFYTKKGGHRHEGLATLFRKLKFKVNFKKGVLLNEVIKEKNIFSDLLSKVSGNYKDISKLLAQDTALQVILLENTEYPENTILIANTHLYSNKDTPEVRLIQTAVCLYYLEHLIKTESFDGVPLVFCGDFNSLPTSEAYNFITSGNFHCCPSWKNNNIDSIEDSTLRHSFHFQSACGTPTYTNYTEEFQGCLDYIFYTKNSLQVTDIVPMPSHEKVTAQIGLPSDYFPSDHLALICTLKWKNKET